MSEKEDHSRIEGGYRDLRRDKKFPGKLMITLKIEESSFPDD